jgi:hypothetical protein
MGRAERNLLGPFSLSDRSVPLVVSHKRYGRRAASYARPAAPELEAWAAAAEGERPALGRGSADRPLCRLTLRAARAWG